MILSQKQKDILKKMRPWAICLGVFIILFFSPNFYLLFSSGRWNGRQAVCAAPGTGVQPNDLEYTALQKIVQNLPQEGASDQVLTTGRVIYSSEQETFYLQDGIFTLPIDTSDCQGLDVFKNGNTFAVVSGNLISDNGYEFLAANNIASTVPNWVTNLVMVALFVAVGLIIGFIILIVRLLEFFFSWLFLRLGIKKPKPAAAETKEMAAGPSRRAGVLSIILSVLAPIFWLFSFVVGIVTQILLSLYVWRVLKKSMPKTALAVMILCGAGFFIMAFIFIGIGGFSATSTTASVTYAVSPLGGWIVGGAPGQTPLEVQPYVSSTLGFSIHPPKNWIVSSTADVPLLFVGPIDGSVGGQPFQPELKFSGFPAASVGATSTDGFVGVLEASLKDEYKDASFIEENHTLDGGRLEAEYINATYTNASGTPSHALVMVATNSGIMYVIGSEMPAVKWSSYESLIRDSLATFDMQAITYFSDKLHFSIAAPLEWTAAEPGPNGTVIVLENSVPDPVGKQTFYANINIGLQSAKYNDHRDVDQAIAQLKSALPQLLGKYTVVEDEATTTGLGEDMALLGGTFTQGGIQLHDLVAVAVGRGNLYEITATTLASTWATYEPMIMSALESFQIPGPTNLGEFVNCLKNKDVIFYGASWCNHCQAQKRLLGSAADQLQYVECAAPSGRYVNDACSAKDLTEFPTWEFADGSRLVGEQSLQTIAQKTGCKLPSGQ